MKKRKVNINRLMDAKRKLGTESKVLALHLFLHFLGLDDITRKDTPPSC